MQKDERPTPKNNKTWCCTCFDSSHVEAPTASSVGHFASVWERLRLDRGLKARPSRCGHAPPRDTPAHTTVATGLQCFPSSSLKGPSTCLARGSCWAFLGLSPSSDDVPGTATSFPDTFHSLTPVATLLPELKTVSDWTSRPRHRVRTESPCWKTIPPAPQNPSHTGPEARVKTARTEHPKKRKEKLDRGKWRSERNKEEFSERLKKKRRPRVNHTKRLLRMPQSPLRVPLTTRLDDLPVRQLHVLCFFACASSSTYHGGLEVRSNQSAQGYVCRGT